MRLRSSELPLNDHSSMMVSLGCYRRIIKGGKKIAFVSSNFVGGCVGGACGMGICTVRGMGQAQQH